MVTGLCSFNVQDSDTLPIWGIEHWQLDHIGTGLWFEQLRETLTPNSGAGLDTVVAMESFILTPGGNKKSPAPYSLETIGAVRYFVETSGLTLRFSAPSAHKKLISDQVLKNADLWFPGEGHACDAARVALHVILVDHGLMRWALKGPRN